MSWSLRLRNGDLSVSGAQIGTVSNEDKLTQDLRCWFLEHMGTDNLHPGYGSTLDGGMQPDGTQVTGVVGTVNRDIALLKIQTEIQRIVREYQAQQLARAKTDRLVYNKTTLTAREVLLSISGINAAQTEDTLTLTLFLRTAAGQDVDIDVALPTTGGIGI
jgi:hypothetical protein